MTKALSYLELDGREVSNSARLAAFQSAGLVPSQLDIVVPPCGVLVREASKIAGTLPTLAGYWDGFPQKGELFDGSSPAYVQNRLQVPGGGYQSTVLPEGTASESKIRPNTGALNDRGAVGAMQSGVWADGVVVLPVDREDDLGAQQVVGYTYARIPTATMRPTNAYVETVAPYWLGARYTALTNSTASLSVGYMTTGGTVSFTVLSSVLTFTAPAQRRVWLVMRLSGLQVTAELWLQDPRCGGGPAQSQTYALSTTSTLGSGQTEAQQFANAGWQGFALYGGGASVGTGGATSPGFFATPTQTYTAHLYPSPFLYPSPTLYPDEAAGGGQSVLPTTPWTDTSRPESGDFLGFYIDDVEGLDGSTTRSVTQRIGGLGGAALGSLVQAGRALKVHGWIVARSCRGLDYGREWLTDVLADRCATCPTSELRVRTAVPSPDDGSADLQGLYEMYDVGLTDGPQITTPYDDCVISEVNFTLTSGNGFKYQPRVLVDQTTFAAVNGQLIVTLPAPPVLGTSGAIVVLSAGSSDLLGVAPAEQLATYPSDLLYPSDCLYPNDGGSPVTLPLTSCPSGFFIPRIPAGYTLTIDSSRHTVTLTDPSGNQSDGTYLLSQDTAHAIQWIESNACDTAGQTVSVVASSYAPDATITVYAKHREG